MGTMEADRGRPLAIDMAYKYHELRLISIKARDLSNGPNLKFAVLYIYEKLILEIAGPRPAGLS